MLRDTLKEALLEFCDQRTNDVLVPLSRDHNSEYYKQINKCEQIFKELATILDSHGLNGNKLMDNFQSAELCKSGIAIEAAYMQGLEDGLALKSKWSPIVGGIAG